MKRQASPLPILSAAVLVAVLLRGGGVGGGEADAPATLKDAFKRDFLIGVAINQRQFSGEDPRGIPIIETQLHYNDYSLEKEAKRNGAIALLQKLLSQGIPITAVGLQNHDNMEGPTPEEEDAAITAFARQGERVMITELDIDVAPPPQRSGAANSQAAASAEMLAHGLSDAMQGALATRHADLFKVFLKQRRDVDRVTFWGVTDGDL